MNRILTLSSLSKIRLVAGNKYLNASDLHQRTDKKLIGRRPYSAVKIAEKVL